MWYPVLLTFKKWLKFLSNEYNYTYEPRIRRHQKKALPVLLEEGVIRSSIFGSYVRGDNREDSDIDILVELPKGKSLLDLVGLEQKLKVVLGKDVDLLTYKSISPYLKDYINHDQMQIL